MKKKLIISGLCGLGLLLLGAVAIDKMVIEPKVISSWGELVDAYYAAREELPPLPLQVEDTLRSMEAGDWSFLSDHWQVRQTGGIWYVAEKSELAKLKFPLNIRIFEDIRLGEVIVMSSPDGIHFQGEAVFSAPEIRVGEASNLDADGRKASSSLTEKETVNQLFWELSARRIVWEITLKPESDAWSDLITRSAPASTEKSVAGADGFGEMMLRSVPAEHTNDLWLCIAEPQSGGTNTLEVFAPEWMTNIEVFACSSLLDGLWTRVATNINPSGPTNPAVISAGSSDKKFFRARTWGDADGDGLSDGQELYEYKTDPYSADSDGDGLSDYDEIYVHETDPNNPDTDGDGMPDGWEVEHGLNPLVDDADEDPDGDNFTNLHEYLIGTDPQSNMSIVEMMIFDEDTGNILDQGPYVWVTNDVTLAYSGTNSVQLSLHNQWNYYPRISFDGATFGNNDTLEFYIRHDSGIYTNALRVRVYYSDKDEMRYPVDIRPYLYDTNGTPSPGSITEEYKRVSIPWGGVAARRQQYGRHDPPHAVGNYGE